MPGEYDVYWAEWDFSMVVPPSSTFENGNLDSTMNLKQNYPRLDQVFAYEGWGSDLHAGYPGYDPSQYLDLS